MKRSNLSPMLRDVVDILGEFAKLACTFLIVTLLMALMLEKRPDVDAPAMAAANQTANLMADRLASALSFRFGAELPPEMPGFSLKGWSVTRAHLEMAGMAGVFGRNSRLAGCEMTTKPLSVAVEQVATRNDPVGPVLSGDLKVRVLTERSYDCMPGTTHQVEELLHVQRDQSGAPEIVQVVSLG